MFSGIEGIPRAEVYQEGGNEADYSYAEDDAVDDPVIREIDVYLSTDLAENLHVIQYPNRPFYRPYDAPATARVRPLNKMLEMEYDLPKDSPHIDSEAPRHLRLDRIKLQSSYLESLTTYALGVIKNNELHLNPISGIYQMRSSCEHADIEGNSEVGDMEGEEEESENEDVHVKASSSTKGSNGTSTQPSPAPVVKLQHIEYKKRESEKAAAARRTSYAYKRQIEEAECWKELKVHPLQSEESLSNLETMFCRDFSRKIRFHESQDKIATEMLSPRGSPTKVFTSSSPVENVHGDGLMEVIPDQATLIPSSPSSSPAVGMGRAVPLYHLQGPEKVAAIFERATLVSFQQVVELMHIDNSSSTGVPSAGPRHYTDLLEMIKKHAVLVRGNWVRKSSFYAAHVVEARDGLLFLLERFGAVNRPQYIKALGGLCGDDEILALLSTFAVLDEEHRMWTLKVPDDVEFLATYPEVVSQQQRFWQSREKALAHVLQKLGGEPDCPYPGPACFLSSRDAVSTPDREADESDKSSPIRPSRLRVK